MYGRTDRNIQDARKAWVKKTDTSDMANSLKSKTWTMYENYEILKKIEMESLCAFMQKNYIIPKQTLSHWVTDKNKIYAIAEANSSTKRIESASVTI